MARRLWIDPGQACTLPECDQPTRQAVSGEGAYANKRAAFCDDHIGEALFRWEAWEREAWVLPTTIHELADGGLITILGPLTAEEAARATALEQTP